MTDNVIALSSNATFNYGDPDPDIVEKLEELLADARSGSLRGFAYVAVDKERSITTNWAGRADSHDMAAGANMLNYRVVKATLEE